MAKNYPSSKSLLEIDLKALKNNVKLFKSILKPNTFFCPMVKDQAYGHGAIPVTQALLEEGVKQVGVISIEEACELRDAISQSFGILVFGPVLNKKNQDLALKKNITLVVNNWVDLEYLSQSQKKIKIHIKFDTGFSRLGFSLEEAQKVQEFISQNPHIHVEALCTQLISGESMGEASSFSYKQVEKLKALSSYFPQCFFHAFNTQACISVYQKNYPNGLKSVGVRLGIGLYGCVPNADLKNLPEFKELKPVSSLTSYVVNVNCLKKGDRVSYGGLWEASQPSVLITVSLGYASGFFKTAPLQREVLFRGKRAPVVGAVCMDFFMADVTSCLDQEDSLPELGEEVCIFGKQGEAELSVEELAHKTGTTPYELFVQFGKTAQKEYK